MSKSSSKKPAYSVFNVVNKKDGNSIWNDAGGAFLFTTKEGRKGINIPNFNLVLLEPK